MARPLSDYSYFRTVAELLGAIRQADKPDTRSNPIMVAARAHIPRRLPAATYFLAWELYYKNPNAVQLTLEALNELPKVKKQ